MKSPRHLAAIVAAISWFSSLCGVARAGDDRTGAGRPHEDAHSEAPTAHREAWESVDLVASGGVGTPIGFGGAAVDWSPTRWLALYAGTGLSAHGPQSALLARVRWQLDDGLAVAIGAGPSYGRYEWNGVASGACETCAARKTWSLATWMNVEASIEGRARSGLQWRVYGGVGDLLDPKSASCTGDATSCARGASGLVGYVGSSLGFAL